MSEPIPTELLNCRITASSYTDELLPDDEPSSFATHLPFEVRQGDLVVARVHALLLRVRLAAHPDFRVLGADLYRDLPLAPWEAALGATMEIPTPDGRVSLKVPAGSQEGKLLRLKGHGAPRLRGSGRGDLLARLRITVPAKLSKAEREALEGFQRASRANPRERLFD